GKLEFLVKWKGYPTEEISHHHLTFQWYTNFMKLEMPKRLFGWEDGKFDREYLEKLEQNWRKWKGVQKEAYRS
ncbi:hypothetical protein AMATHDRAFT_156246, partial [Amanita thiersii Skay4041]